MSRLPPVPATTPLQRFLGHTATLARTLATVDGPPTLDLLIEENVCQQVKNVLASDIIRQVSNSYFQGRKRMGRRADILGLEKKGSGRSDCSWLGLST